MPAPGDQYRDTKASINPFEERLPHISEYTAREIATLQSRLDKQLGPEYISTRPGAGGGKVHYLAAEKVINLANEVFGFHGWSSAIQNVQVDFVDESPTSGKITLGLSIIVRVTLRNGTFHEDIGYGHIENCKGKAAAFEKAKKEAATDALKRALRNFGNVLGNCLYDKDYLQKITKIKVAPSRWDAENLHHHPDYAPIKKDVTTDGLAQGAARPKRLESTHSTITNGTEYGEDEFGGNLFDGVDFSHPDEVVLDASTIESAGSDAARTVSEQARQQATRVHSMPDLNTRRPGQPPAPQQPSRPPEPQRNSSNVGRNRPDQVGASAHPNPNQTGQTSNVQHQPPNRFAQASGGVPNAVAHGRDQDQSGSNQTNGDQLTPPAPHGPQGAPQDSATSEIPPDMPVGFVRPGAPTTRPFDPRIESPSIRRTIGVNSGKSEPIRRSVIQGGAPADSNGPPAVPNSVTPQQSRSNFVNPAADANRRIGMPGAMQSPMANRGSYKPPSAVKRAAPMDAPSRPPLTDMSNMQQVDGASESKKPKVDSMPPPPPNNVAS